MDTRVMQFVTLIFGDIHRWRLRYVYRQRPVTCNRFEMDIRIMQFVTLIVDGSQCWRLRCGAATVSRIHKMIGLLCRIASLLQGPFAKETSNYIDPTNRSHPICVWPNAWMQRKVFVQHVAVTVCSKVSVGLTFHIYMHKHIHLYTLPACQPGLWRG